MKSHPQRTISSPHQPIPSSSPCISTPHAPQSSRTQNQAKPFQQHRTLAPLRFARPSSATSKCIKATVGTKLEEGAVKLPRIPGEQNRRMLRRRQSDPDSRSPSFAAETRASGRRRGAQLHVPRHVAHGLLYAFHAARDLRTSSRARSPR